MNDQATNVTSPQQMIAAVAAAPENGLEGRIVYYSDFPPRLAATVGVKVLGIVVLTVNEEMMATQRASNNAIKLAFESAKESLRLIDGVPINTGDLSADQFWARKARGMAQLRSLVLTAYGTIHNPLNEDTQSFLSSRREVARS